MRKNYNQNSILKYLYGELSDKEAEAFETAMHQQESLYREVQQLKHLLGQLDQIVEEPSEEVLNNILKVAEETERKQFKV